MQMLREEQRAPTAVVAMVLVGFIGIVYVLNWFANNPATANARFWFLERSAGFVAYELLSLTVILGVSMTSRLWDRWKLRKLVNDVHQQSSLLVVPFVFLHVWGIYSDKSVPFSVQSLLIPLHAHYRPLAVAAGVVSLYLLLMIVITSYARPWLGAKVWRSIHFVAFPLFIGVTVHGFFAGTDSARIWAQVMYIVPLVIFIGLTLKRLMWRQQKRGAANGSI